jgi:hypothetical protein
MYIKKDRFTKNEYIFAGDIWVRNFLKPSTTSVILNNLYRQDDYHIVMLNEIKNANFSDILKEKINFSKIVIVSDGFAFASRHKLIAQFPKDVAVFAVNKVLKEWKLHTDPTNPRSINAYIVNNPYPECASYLPIETKYYPACVASRRTNYNFLQKYQGTIYTYNPTCDYEFGNNTDEGHVDDYRNPICAAIDLSYRFGVEKLMLLCCDDSFKIKKDASVLLENGLYTYPQHLRAQEIVDAKLYWLTQQENKSIKICDFSEGAKYNNALCIHNNEEAIEFFK